MTVQHEHHDCQYLREIHITQDLHNKQYVKTRIPSPSLGDIILVIVIARGQGYMAVTLPYIPGNHAITIIYPTSDWLQITKYAYS